MPDLPVSFVNAVPTVQVVVDPLVSKQTVRLSLDGQSADTRLFWKGSAKSPTWGVNVEELHAAWCTHQERPCALSTSLQPTFPCESTTFALPTQMHSAARPIHDGVDCSEYVAEAFVDMSLVMSEASVLLTRYPVQVVTQSFAPMANTNLGFDGVLGLAGYRCRDVSLSNYLRERYWTLSLGSHNPRLSFVETPPLHVVWSPSATVEDAWWQNRLAVGVLQPQVCGRPLGQSGLWTAVFDPSSSCLSLPERYFESLVANLRGVTCHQRCTILPELRGRLPSLQISVTLASAAISFDLNQLVGDPDERGHLDLCLLQTHSLPRLGILDRRRTPLSIKAPIIFGHKMLQGVDVTWDRSLHRIGLQSNVTAIMGDACEPTTICKTQAYDPYSNSCVVPKCPLLFELTDQNSCRVRGDWFVLGAFLMLMLGVLRTLSKSLIVHYD
ncbi:MAG: hypothetical protein KVP17_003013 [Porospora cf. gigantea B]|uniref:uncharacterized protein n=1 Tax=Porospora cf. gigantea B TaxID=2853592 RepID=UPI00357180A0|nr:MAG: hypothetical protein KVP17_003013 [Porospora cf. gigantea B]